MAEHDHTVHIAVADGSCVGSSVKVEYLGLDQPRLDAISQSASNLIASMFDISMSAPNCDCVWPLGEQADWNREYLLPLFLVAFGLLRFAPQLGNQQAAILTVLALATHVRDSGVLHNVQGATAT